MSVLSKKQVAELLGVSAHTVSRLVQAGKLPAPISFSKRLLRWRMVDVEQALADLALGVTV
jgi:excisionase family DNA binding protein